MPNLNRVILCGLLTRDPETRYTPKGAAVCDFGLAINRNWKNESGEKQEEVTFVDVSAFGKQAETISQYMKKGRPILLEGRLKLDQWEKEGKKFSKLKVVLESFQFLGDGKGKDDGRKPSAPTAPSEPAPAPAGKDDDVPF